MWVKLGSEFLNLDHVLRVRFNKAWNKEGECLVGEVESLVNGDLKTCVRYRGPDAETLQCLLLGRAGATGPGSAPAANDPAAPLHAAAPSSSSPTLTDL
jgi:hypothetical protein